MSVLERIEDGGVVGGVVWVKRGQKGAVFVTGVGSHLHTETVATYVVLYMEVFKFLVPPLFSR